MSPPLQVSFLELAVVPQSFLFSEGQTSGAVFFHAVRTFLPARRRRAITFLPPGEDILCLNPCFLLRFRFVLGFNVFFIAGYNQTPFVYVERNHYVIFKIKIKLRLLYQKRKISQAKKRLNRNCCSFGLLQL